MSTTNATCPDCAKALAKYNRLDDRMARRGNFGIVPLPKMCKWHLRLIRREVAFAKKDSL